MKKENYTWLKGIIAEKVRTGKWIIDLEEGVLYNRHGKKMGSRHNTGYTQLVVDKKFIQLHQLIAVAGGMDLIDLQVNHIDGNKLNNSFNNLERVTQSENTQHAIRTGLFHTKKLPEDTVRAIKLLLAQKVAKAEISRMYGVSTRSLRNIADGITYRKVEI